MTQDDATRKRIINERLAPARSLSDFKTRLQALAQGTYTRPVCEQIDRWMSAIGQGGMPPTKEQVLACVRDPDIADILYRLFVPRTGHVPEDGKTVTFDRDQHGAIGSAPTGGGTLPKQESDFDPNATSMFGRPTAVASTPAKQVAPVNPKESTVLVKTVYGTLLALASMIEAGNSSDESKRLSEYLRKCAENLLNV